MPQVINTNMASINAQRNLDKSNDGLQISLQRLSSGLRINSAKDDAAGLAISTRFSSTIQGLSQAKRNANDGISLAQVTEGALQEVTRILQRSRELAIQAANGTNTSSDRKAIQSEVNELKQELTRIATTTSYNGLNVLNGDLKNASFQIGAEANQTVSVTVNDTRTNAIGANQLTSSNTNGLESSTKVTFIGGGLNGSDAAGVAMGSDIGVVSVAAAAGNGYSDNTFTVSNTTSTGATNSQSFTIGGGDAEADDIATSLSTLTGVTATAFNHVQITNFTSSDAADEINIVINGQTAAAFTDSSSTYETAATVINTDTNFSSMGVYAISTGTSLDIISTRGHDIVVDHVSSGADTLRVESKLDAAGTVAVGSTSSATVGGRLDISLEQGYSIQESTPSMLGTGAGDITTGVASGQSFALGTGINFLGAQTLTVAGPDGSASVSLTANQEASSVVTAVNAVSGTTGVKATATTVVKLDNLSADGTVSFNLYGDNSNASSISASVTGGASGDLSALRDAVNNASGSTGITAALGATNSELVLTHSLGKDVIIENFTHSGAVDYQDVVNSPLSDGGTGVVAAAQQSMRVTGNPDSNSGGVATTLFDGGAQNGQDSTVVGGEITFSSTGTFNVTSNISGSGNQGTGSSSGTSLFSGGVSSGNTSTLSNVAQVDVSTASGAQSAINVLDEAIQQIASQRSSLGAVQSRFKSAIDNLSNNIENLSIARSRILDADFATETAELTKNQILVSAGITILSQANSLPQNVLQLLQ